jgi:hypothetical protein
MVQWSGFLAIDPDVRVRFQALPHFLRSTGLERGSLSLVSTIEELLGRNRRGLGVKNRDYGRRVSASLTMRQPSIRKIWL